MVSALGVSIADPEHFDVVMIGLGVIVLLQAAHLVASWTGRKS